MTKSIRIVLLFFLGASCSSLWAQIGGRDNYRFLLMPNSARITGLGSVNVSAPTDDPSMALLNPAILSEKMHQGLSFNHQFFFAGIQNGYFSYAHHIGGARDITLHTGFQYINYGDFRWTDEFDQHLGVFSAGEFAWNVGGSMQVYDRLRVGANAKIINSNMETYNAFALGMDLGAFYFIEEQDLSIGFTIHNIGTTLASYTETASETMPYDVRLGISKKLAKAPFRFSVTAHNLHRWNLMYDNPEQEERNTLFSDMEPEDNVWSMRVDNLFRHLVFATELLLGKQENFKIFLSYNHLRQREMAIRNLRSFNGISAGFAFRVKQFELSYGFGNFHLAGGAHHLSIHTNLKRFTRDVQVD